jgi:hypothetical protein
MTGLWPRSVFNISFLQAPVKDDQIAEIILAEIAGLEAAKARVQWFAAEMVKKYDRALSVLAESEAVKSLPAYVKDSTGKKTLELPAGTIKVRVQKDILRVYDEKLARINCPEAVYSYQAPPAEKLSKDKLKAHIEAHGPLTVEGEDGLVTIAEIIPEVETVQIVCGKPSGELAGAAQPPRLLAEMLNREEAENENANRAAE